MTTNQPLRVLQCRPGCYSRSSMSTPQLSQRCGCQTVVSKLTRKVGKIGLSTYLVVSCYPPVLNIQQSAVFMYAPQLTEAPFWYLLCTSSCTQKRAKAWVRHSSPSFRGSLCHESNKIGHLSLKTPPFFPRNEEVEKVDMR